METMAPGLSHVYMKTRRAEMHLEALELEVANWLKREPYVVVTHDDFDKGYRFFAITANAIPDLIFLLAGDFVCCLRAALDQLAWHLAHLDKSRVWKSGEEGRVQFPIFSNPDTYRDRRRLFPSAVADIFDTLQPHLRGNAYRDDPLWQLNELWNLDKHRTIPANSNRIEITFPVLVNWDRQARKLDECVIVRVPIVHICTSPVEIKPSVTVEILFGDFMGSLEITAGRLREIHDFTRDEVIPRFTRFFPESPDSNGPKL